MAHKLKKVLLYILPCVFLMSHIITNNVSALISDDVNLVGTFAQPQWRFRQTSDGSWSTYSKDLQDFQINNNGREGFIAAQFVTNNGSNITYNVGDYFVFTGVVNVFNTGASYTSNVNDTVTVGVSGYSSTCSVMDVDLDGIASENNAYGQTYLTSRYVITGVCTTTGGTSNPVINLRVWRNPTNALARFGVQFTGLYRYTQDTSISTLYSRVGELKTIMQNIYSNNEDILDVLNDIHSNQHDVNQEQTDATNNSVQQSENAGNTSETDTNNTTQSLMSAGTSIIGALTSAPATDCNINISTTGNSSSFTSAIGNLNLCSDVPSGVLTLVQGMVALVFTPIVLYYVYNILTLIYAQFKEYNS